MAHMLVLGGGFGGLAAAHTLRRELADTDEITVIASREAFFVGFAKLWDLVGLRQLADGSAPLARLERHGIRFLHAEITAIDPQGPTVETTRDVLRGDGMVVALGAGYAEAHLKMLGAIGHNLYDATALPRIREALDHLEGGRLVISILGLPYQCPPAPYEAMLLLDEWFRARRRRDAVELVLSTPQQITLPVAGPDASRFVSEQLVQRGVSVLTERTVTGIDGVPTVTFGDDDRLSCDLLLGVPAAAPLPVLARSPLAGASGWVEPDPATFRTAFDRVYAVGDCTRVPTATAELPKAGVFAEGAGRVAAANLARDLYGGEPAAFSGFGSCFLELPGRRVATVSGNFYARPRPEVTLSQPNQAAYTKKQHWEQERLAHWLG